MRGLPGRIGGGAVAVLFVIAGLGGPEAWAGEAEVEPAADESEAADGDDGAIGLNVDLMYATAYVFRGLNVFQGSSQMDQRGLLAPGITWSIFDTGLSLAYWGAFQVYGSNIGALVDEATGLEQDLSLTYDFDVIEEVLTGTLRLCWYFYPFADSELTGATIPSWLEPAASLTFSSVIDVSLELAYMTALNERWWYFYVHPSISRELELHSMVSLSLAFGYGYKQYNDPSADTDNVHDVGLDVELTIAPLDWLYVMPAVHAAWTNFADRGFEDEYLIWGSLNVGVDL